MSSSRHLFLKHIAQTSLSPMMLEIESAKGVFLYDTSGKPYFDMIAGVNVSSLGHNHPQIVNAVKEQVDKHMHVMVYGEFLQDVQTGYASLLTSFLPGQLSSVYFVNSGAEAIEGAMKIARKFTGRPEMVSFKNAYHGSTQGAMSLMGGDFYKKGYFPLLPGVKHIEYNSIAALDAINRDTAAVIVEVLQAEAGMICPDREFLVALRERCTQTGSLLVFDEIQTSFGRLGSLFGFESVSIVPDILVLAKSLGGGMPLGAFISSREIMEVLSYDPPLGHITTFGGHPVSCAAGKASLEYVLDHDLIEQIGKKEQLFRSLLQHELILDIGGKGLMLAVEMGEEKRMLDLVDEGLKLGFVTDWFLFNSSSFRISPPLNISLTEIEDLCALIIQALDNLANQ